MAVSPSLRARIERLWVFLWDPAVQLCIQLGIPPDAISVTGVVLTAVAALLIGIGDFSFGGWLYLMGASLDLVDGRLARATGTASRAGAFLDSTLDRVGEMLVLGALAIQFRASPVLIAVLAAVGTSVLVSYARARGESLGAGMAARVGRAQRSERVAVVAVSCILHPLAETLLGRGAGRTVVGGSLALLAVLALATAVSRSLSIYRFLRGQDSVARSIDRTGT